MRAGFGPGRGWEAGIDTLTPAQEPTSAGVSEGPAPYQPDGEQKVQEGQGCSQGQRGRQVRVLGAGDDVSRGTVGGGQSARQLSVRDLVPGGPGLAHLRGEDEGQDLLWEGPTSHPPPLPAVSLGKPPITAGARGQEVPRAVTLSLKVFLCEMGTRRPQREDKDQM